LGGILRKTGNNGARSAPFQPSRGRKTERLVHVVHRFSGKQPENQSNWCIQYTIVDGMMRENRKNGACGAPFWQEATRKAE
jgi:hypothetical protein